MHRVHGIQFYTLHILVRYHKSTNKAHFDHLIFIERVLKKMPKAKKACFYVYFHLVKVILLWRVPLTDTVEFETDKF